MQEDKSHLNKRWQVLSLFKPHYPDPEHENEWVDKNKEEPKGDTIVMGKFLDDTEEKLFYCSKYPNWWYFHSKREGQVVTKELGFWKALKSEEV